MNSIRTAVAAWIVIGFVACGQGFCQEAAESPSNDDLRREVAELRATIAELSKRLETLEYQKMPRAELPIPQLAEPRNPVPSYIWPTVQPARFPVEVHQMPKTTSAPTKRSVPAYLRFSEEIERAMMGPF
jgi:hypothetical protein